MSQKMLNLIFKFDKSVEVGRLHPTLLMGISYESNSTKGNLAICIKITNAKNIYFLILTQGYVFY